MNDQLFWVIVGVIVAAIPATVTLVTFWMQRGSKEAETGHNAAAALNMATTALAKIELHHANFVEHKLEMAAKIAALEAVTDRTVKSLVEAEARLTKALENMTERMDGLLEALAKPR